MAAITRVLGEAEEAFQRDDLARAARLLGRVLLAAPAHSRAHELMAYVEGRRGNLDSVFAHLDKATRAPGATASAWYYLGVWFRTKGRHADAVIAFGRALERGAGLFAAAHDLGMSNLELREPLAALAAFDRALEIDRGSFEARHNRGRALHELGRFEEALVCFDEALVARPDSVPTRLNRGEVLNELHRFPEAVDEFARVSARSPGNAEAELNEALVRLVLGQFEIGWRKYEARWKALGLPPRHTDITAWSGEPDLTGKRILVWCEQGFGDTLQFCRYASLLAERGSNVVLEVQPELKGLLSRLPGCEVIAEGESFARCDYQIPLLSLPRAFGTTLATIPAGIRYVSTDPEKVAAWASRLGRRGERKRVGIACSGQSGQKELRDRSMALGTLAPLQEHADLFLVQIALREEDLEHLRGRGSAIRSLAGEIRDFEDSACILENMDLVVTVDTSLAHVAGALGRPVWVLLPSTPTWRWLVDREDCPWYPTARLFRQESRGDWEAVVARVAKALSPAVSLPSR